MTGNLVRDNFGLGPKLSLNILVRADNFLLLIVLVRFEKNSYLSVCEHVCATVVVCYEFN